MFEAEKPAIRGERDAVEVLAEVLDRWGAATCEHDLLGRDPPHVTGGFRYVRRHGTTGAYRGRYGKRALAPLARSLRRGAHESFVYFNNDLGGHALLDALDLLELVGEGRREALSEATRAALGE
jgi:uncharacterized protein YecE (DUF72 family)